jgi:hypothetical protein
MAYFRRNISFPTIPHLEPAEADDYKKNHLGQVVYRAKNSDISRNVTYNKYYWVDENKNHLPFLVDSNPEIAFNFGIPTNIPTQGETPFLSIDPTTGLAYTFETTTNTWNQIGAGSGGINIYNSNGLLTGSRIVSGSNTYDLNFIALIGFKIDSTEVTLTQSPLLNNSATEILVRNPLSGVIEKMDINSLDKHFAKDDLTLTGNRLHNLLNNQLHFAGSPFSGFTIDTGNFTVSATASIFSGLVRLVDTPVTDITQTSILVRNSVTGNIEQRPAGGLTNFSISDNTSTFPVTGGDVIDFITTNVGPLRFTITSNQVNLNLNTTGLTAGQVLGYNGASLTMLPLTNIYNSNGVLTSNRTLSGAGFNLIMNGMSTLYMSGANTGLQGSSSLSIITPNVTGGFSTVGQVLTLNNVTGVCEWADPPAVASAALDINDEGITLTSTPASIDFTGSGVTATTIGNNVTVNIPGSSGANIYNSDGTLAGNRTMTGGGFSFTGTGFSDFNISSNNSAVLTGTDAILEGSVSVRLRTPSIISATATVGQVFTLTSINGTGEWTSLPTTFAPLLDVKDEGVSLTTTPTEFNFVGSGVTATQVANAVTITIPGGVSTNIYNADGTLTGNRVVTGGGFDLQFAGINTLSQVTQTTSIAAFNALELVTPAVIASTATVGQVLTLTNAVSGDVEFTDLPTITIKDEGVDLTTDPVSINFAGAGVSATQIGNAVTVTIAGGTTVTPQRDDFTIAIASSTVTATMIVNSGFHAMAYRNGLLSDATKVGQVFTFTPALSVGETVSLIYYV